MSLVDIFEIAGGSILGHHHVLTGKNNQDSFCYSFSKNLIVGVVADGCGSTPYSEMGSRIGANALLASIKDSFDALMRRTGLYYSGSLQSAFWRNIGALTLGKMESIIKIAFPNNLIEDIVRDHFLFTLVGFIITKEEAFIFSYGDGMWCVNGEVNSIGPFPGNAPPYIGHKLIGRGPGFDKKISVHKGIDTSEVSSILIGSDGCDDFVKAENKSIPGKETKLVGPISQFWESDKIFSGNSDMVRRRLATVAKIHQKVDWDKKTINKSQALLNDDTTLIVVRRKAL